MRTISCCLFVALAGSPVLSAGAAAFQDYKPQSPPPKQPSQERGQPSRDQSRPDSDRPMTRTDVRGWNLCSYEKLKGANVVNAKDEKIADITDFIVNRGSGRIEHVLVKTDTVLGLGGSTLVVPFGSFRWTGEKNERPVLDMTQEQLKTYPTFTKENWAGLVNPDEARRAEKKDVLYDLPAWVRSEDSRDRSVATELEGSESRTMHGARHEYELGDRDLSSMKTTSINGTVMTVDRVWLRDGEYTLLQIKDTDGKTREVLLGPSWYVSGAALSPTRGDVVRTNVYTFGNNVLIAQNVHRGNDELGLRDERGVPEWTRAGVYTQGKARYAPSYYRYILMSDLDGMDVTCRGTACGKIDDVITDRRNGEVALLSIDPDQNFLGIADTKHLIPWELASVAVTNDAVRIDASKEMILASTKTPSDITTLNDPQRIGAIYDPYGIRYDDSAYDRGSSRDQDRYTLREGTRGWTRDGSVMKAIDHSASRTITGKISGFKELRLGDGIDPATVAEIRTADGTERVILGPTAYVKGSPRMCSEGADVTVHACRATINGKEHWVANRIECGNVIVLVDPNSGPAWEGLDR